MSCARRRAPARPKRCCHADALNAAVAWAPSAARWDTDGVAGHACLGARTSSATWCSWLRRIDISSPIGARHPLMPHLLAAGPVTSRRRSSGGRKVSSAAQLAAEASAAPARGPEHSQRRAAELHSDRRLASARTRRRRSSQVLSMFRRALRRIPQLWIPEGACEVRRKTSSMLAFAGQPYQERQT